MVRGVRGLLLGSFSLIALGALTGCGGWFFAEREPWRLDAEVACVNSGAIQEGPSKVRIAAINGPGVCGAEYPFKVSVLGESAILNYVDEPRPRAGMLQSGEAVSITPAATLACPIVSALDQWIANSVQPAALRWFGQPVSEIKQISAYSCRGMNGNPNANISEHAFGNALDIAAFTLADGRKIDVRTGWEGAPAEQGFLRDVESAACEQFTTVLAPGSNAYHYNHIHVDLMRRSSGRRACNPRPVSGEEVAARAAARARARSAGGRWMTGTESLPSPPKPIGPQASSDMRRKLSPALPGEDGEY
jgi:hypothetical protein